MSDKKVPPSKPKPRKASPPPPPTQLPPPMQLRLIIGGMSSDMTEPVELDPLILVVNMLLATLRRSARGSLGEDATSEEVKALMLRLAAQGMRDTLEHGVLPPAGVRQFVNDVVRHLEEEKRR